MPRDFIFDLTIYIWIMIGDGKNGRSAFSETMFYYRTLGPERIFNKTAIFGFSLRLLRDSSIMPPMVIAAGEPII